MNEAPRYKILENSVLGRSVNKKEKITILGAGISGLIMGYYLKKNNFDFEIKEISDRPGGILQTFDAEFGVIENAAVSFRYGEEIIALCEDLGLEVIKASTLSNKKYFFRDGEFRRFPLNTYESVKTVFNILFSTTETPQNLEEFGKNHLSESALYFLLEPAMQGIYGASSSDLSFPAVMPEMAESLNNNNNLRSEVYKILFKKRDKNETNKPLGFKSGMRELVNALAEYLKDHISYNSTLQKNELADNQVIMSIPAYYAAHYFDEELKKILQNIEYSKLITANVFVTNNSLINFKPGFGCLVPRKEGLHTMGIIYNDFIFPERHRSKFISNLTFILNDSDGALQKKSISRLTDILYEEMKTIFKFDDVFLDYKIQKWDQALPIYSTNLHESWFRIKEILNDRFSNIRLFANYTGNISMRGMCEDAKSFVENSLSDQ